jgi:hypothetical protein
MLYSREALEKSIVDSLRDQVVVTGYSNEIYKIIGVDFGQLPTSYQGKKSFVDILKEKFKVEVLNLEQPMLIGVSENEE